MTLKITFSTPCPHNQRDRIIKSFRELGLSYERIYQSGIYSLHRFYGRLPTVSGHDEDCQILFIDDKTREQFKTHGKVDYIEIFLNIERE